MLAAVATAYGFQPDTKKARLIARNTLDYTAPDGTRRIRLHDTDVVTIEKRGNIILDSGGWQTVTTKDRMNQVLPSGWGIYSNRGWLIRTPQGTFPYADGAKFKPDGTPANLRTIQVTDSRVKKEKALVAKFLKNAAANGWANPAGDPWVFSPNVGREVMLDWVKGDYFTARMMMLALQHAGYMEAGISISMRDLARKGGKPDRFLIGKLRRYIYSQLGIA
jgi:hypothetical protein